MKVITKYGTQSLPKAYFELRYTMLRQPLGSPKGAEKLPEDENALHAWIEDNNAMVAIGRAHLIPENNDGSTEDTAAKSACPGFTPLGLNYAAIQDDSGLEIPTEGLRPAIQIRAMATATTHQNKGLASKVLETLEEQSRQRWHAKTGWLQARISAIPFYEANGWCCFGPEYTIPNVGTHVSMWKQFSGF